MMKKISIAKMAIAAIPPTKPPTIAPIGVGDDVGTVIGALGLATGVVEGSVITVVDVEIFTSATSVIISSNQTFKPTEVGTVVEAAEETTVEEAKAHGAPIEPLISS